MRWLIVSLLLLGACGFEPIYGEGENQAVALPEVRVGEIPGHSGQLFKAALEDRLNPESVAVPPRFEARSGFGVQLIPLSIDPDGTISSFRVLFNTTLFMVDLSTGKVVHEEPVKRSNRYTVSDADYSSFIARDDAIARGTTELANDYFLRIARFLKTYTPQPAAPQPAAPDGANPAFTPEAPQKTPSAYDNTIPLQSTVPAYSPGVSGGSSSGGGGTGASGQ